MLCITILATKEDQHVERQLLIANSLHVPILSLLMIIYVLIDAMVTHRLNQHFLVALGASKQVVQTYQQYDWSFYGKLSFNF
jgi:hypothetical protein